MRLEGKVALITGAAAALQDELMGIGGASAWLFVREGAKVVLCDINEELGQRSVAQIRENGGDAEFVRLDVTSSQDWTDAVDKTVSTFGRLDIAVNNAGTGATFTLDETTEEIWDEQMNVHAKGAFLGTKHVVPAMRKAGGGSIINVSSIMGMVGSSRSSAYSAAKGAIRVFTKSAAVQYAEENIRVNSVHPGFTLTPMTQKRFTVPEIVEERMTSVPMGRLGTADEIAYGILFLASDEASFVTGSELVIDGGFLAQ